MPEAAELTELAIADRKEQLTAPLYKIEDDLLALIDTGEMVTEEQDAAYTAELMEQMNRAVIKRDAVGHFIRHCETMAAASKLERKRLEEREDFYKRVAERMREYVRRILVALGRDERDKWRRLEGNDVTFFLRNNPGSVKITNEVMVEDKYKRATVKIRLDILKQMLLHMGDADKQSVPYLKVESVEISKSAIKDAMEQGLDVAGADLETTQSVVLR